MLHNTRKDTAPELAVRSLLHARGLRYRVDFPVLPRRRADIVFTRQRLAIYIDGCFWHGCPIHATSPKANAEYWSPKLAANVARDNETVQRLEAAGWRVARFWAHESAQWIADEVLKILNMPLAANPRRSGGNSSNATVNEMGAEE